MRPTVGAFALDRSIAVGAMGEVWRATAADGTPVAIKIARSEVRESPVLLELMEGEVRALARLDHPQIAWLYDHGRTGDDGPFPPGCPYLVLEYCSGGTLLDRMPGDWDTARAVLVGLLQALAHAHAHAVVHRDLKPANVLWAGTGDLRPGMKLADFGVAYRMDRGERAPRVGTPWYMAPEQAGSISEIGPWTDLYALGAVAWEIVTGRPPHGGDSAMAVISAASHGPPPLQPRFPVPAGLEGWLRSLLAADPVRRTRRAADALAQLAQLDPQAPPPDRAWRSAAVPGPRLRLQGAGLGLVALRAPDIAGRDAERRALWEELEATRAERRTRVVLLRGISGIGKSRLCRWLVERAAELGLAESVTVPCREGEGLASLLTGLLRIPATRSRRVDTLLATLRERHPDAVERLEPLIRSPARRWGTVPLIRRMLASAAADGPLILVLDDAQDSEDAVRLARALLGDHAEVPLLVVVAVEEESLAADPDRSDQVDALADSEGVRTLTLGPLSPAEQDELLQTLVGLDPEAQSAVLASAGGHPGYVVAQVTSWVRQGVLAPSRRGFHRVGARAPESSWSSVWVRWMADWLGSLDPEDRLLLEQAAVLGRSVDQELWAAACDDPDARVAPGLVEVDLPAARRRAALVERLIRAGLAYDTDLGFTFTHPALVEVLVNQARAAGRLASLHRAAANHVRRRPQPDHALALGRHLAEAEAWDEAAIALFAGIALAWRMQDRRPLLTELERAERCVIAAGWSADDPRRSELLHVRSLLLLTAGHSDEGAALAKAAWELAKAGGDRRQMARTSWRWVDSLAVSGRWEEAEAPLRAFLEVEDPPVRPHWSGLARTRMARVLEDRGDAEGAARWHADAERVLRAQPETIETLAALLETLGYHRRQQELLETAARLRLAAAEAGRLDVLTFSISKEVEALIQLERYDEASEHARTALRINEQLGDRRFGLLMRCQLASIDVATGRMAVAARELRLLLQEMDRKRSPWLVVAALLMRAEAALGLGDLDSVDRDLEEVGVMLRAGRIDAQGVRNHLRRMRAAMGAHPAQLATVNAMLAGLEPR